MFLKRSAKMKLSGVMPPITTPFQDGKFASDKLKYNFEKWNKTGLSGYLVLGSNGESVYLNEMEKIKVVEVSRASIPGAKIMRRNRRSRRQRSARPTPAGGR